MPKAPSEIPSALDNNSTKKQKLHGFLLYACHAGCRAERSRCRRWLRCSPSGKLSKTQTRAATHRTTAKKKEGFHFGGPRRLLGFSWQRLPDLFLLGIAEAFQGPEMMDPGTFCPPPLSVSSRGKRLEESPARWSWCSCFPFFPLAAATEAPVVVGDCCCRRSPCRRLLLPESQCQKESGLQTSECHIFYALTSLGTTAETQISSFWHKKQVPYFGVPYHKDPTI